MYNETIEATIFLEYVYWGENTFTFCVHNIIYCCFKLLITYIEKIGTLVYIEHFWIHLKLPNLCRRPIYGNNFTLQKFIKKKIQQDATMYQNCIIPYLYEAQHVLGDTLPIIRSLKLHWQPLVFHTWKVVGQVDGECGQAQYMPDHVHHLQVQQPFTYEKPEVASAVLGSWWWAVCRPKHVELHINME